MNRSVFIERDRVNLDKAFEDLVGAINNIGEKTGTWTDEPADTANLIITSLRIFGSSVGSIIGIVGVIGIILLFVGSARFGSSTNSG